MSRKVFPSERTIQYMYLQKRVRKLKFMCSKFTYIYKGICDQALWNTKDL